MYRGEMELKTDAAKCYCMMMLTFTCGWMIYMSGERGNWIGVVAFIYLTIHFFNKFWKLYTKKRTFSEE